MIVFTCLQLPTIGFHIVVAIDSDAFNKLAYEIGIHFSLNPNRCHSDKE